MSTIETLSLDFPFNESETLSEYVRGNSLADEHTVECKSFGLLFELLGVRGMKEFREVDGPVNEVWIEWTDERTKGME